ncbi:MAG: hypothetical protein R2860_02260 [Desulfobacterales bacterium]
MIDRTTEEVMGLEPFSDKWEAFGFIVKEVDGHSFKELADAIDFAHNQDEKPVVIMPTPRARCRLHGRQREVFWFHEFNACGTGA